MRRPLSPMQVRIAASAAIRRARLGHVSALLAHPHREPEHGETPLSKAELEFGISRGLIRVDRSRQGQAQ